MSSATSWTPRIGPSGSVRRSELHSPSLRSLRCFALFCYAPVQHVVHLELDHESGMHHGSGVRDLDGHTVQEGNMSTKCNYCGCWLSFTCDGGYFVQPTFGVCADCEDRLEEEKAKQTKKKPKKVRYASS